MYLRALKGSEACAKAQQWGADSVSLRAPKRQTPGGPLIAEHTCLRHSAVEGPCVCTFLCNCATRLSALAFSVLLGLKVASGDRAA